VKQQQRDQKLRDRNEARLYLYQAQTAIGAFVMRARHYGGDDDSIARCLRFVVNETMQDPLWKDGAK